MATLASTYLAFKKRVINEMSGLGLKASQPKILYYIYSHEGCQQKDVAENCFLETATLSTVLSNLEQKQLLIRTPDKDDKRAYKIYSTDEGRKVMELIDDKVKKTMDLAIEGFSRDELKQFSDYIDRLYENLSEYDHK